MNVAMMLGEVIKARHTGDKYKYLVKGVSLYFVLVYGGDDETPLIKEAYLAERDALYRYNHL